MVRLALTRAADFVTDHVIGRPVLLVDFHCFKVPERLTKSYKQIQDALRAQKDKAFVTQGAQDFVFRMNKTSGVATDQTSVPEGDSSPAKHFTPFPVHVGKYCSLTAHAADFEREHDLSIHI